jgi:hypothetical protein
MDDNTFATMVSVRAVASLMGLARCPQLKYMLTNRLSREKGLGGVFLSLTINDRSCKLSIEVKVFLQTGHNLRRQILLDFFKRELITRVFD